MYRPKYFRRNVVKVNCFSIENTSYDPLKRSIGKTDLYIRVNYILKDDLAINNNMMTGFTSDPPFHVGEVRYAGIDTSI